MKVLTLIAALAVATPALADHAVDNASQISRAAYSLADAAEALEIDARRELRGGFGPLTAAAERDDGYTIQDHRHDNLRELYQTARRLHYAASDLYRIARDISRNSGGGFVRRDVDDGLVTPQDHRGDRLRAQYDIVLRSFRSLQYNWSELQRYNLGYNIISDYRWVRRQMNNLEYYVYERSGGF